MNFGYLIIVSESDICDYDRLAYGLALSIKNTQKPGYDRVALVTDDPSRMKRFKSTWVFDEIIQWDKKTFWDGRSFMHDVSPWDYTVCLDADMLFMRDYSHWVDYFVENCDLYVANKSLTYRGEIITQDYYRKAFTKNDLPNLYSFYTFFKKESDISKEFFDLVKKITEYKTEFTNVYLKDHKPKILGTDEIFALAAKILDIADEISYDLEFPRVVHLKGAVQNWPWPADLVTDHVGFYFDKTANLKIGNYQQSDIVHYVEKDKIDLEAISILEEIAWKK
jgi:hypothetical protein